MSSVIFVATLDRVNRYDIDEFGVVAGELKFLSETLPTPHIIVINIAAGLRGLY